MGKSENRFITLAHLEVHDREYGVPRLQNVEC
jgi:hypothetical protein